MKTLHFKTNAQLKNVLGQELINDDNVAVQELVKNSYDAGSKTVNIIFKNLKHNKDVELTKSNRNKLIDESSKIFVIDQGSGMSIEDIDDKWLNIAYSAKRTEKSKKGRTFAGNKGVGRFSCDRLGEFLDLYTKTIDTNKIAHLRINWNEFDDKSNVNDVIQDVDVYLEEPLTQKELEKRLGYTITKSGTILEISKLSTNWIEKKGKQYLYEKIVSLKKALQKLTNPNQNIEKEGFEIKVQVLDLSKQDFDLAKDQDQEDYEILKSELVENKIFTQLDFRTTYIESILDKEHITTTLKYQNKTIFELKERNVYEALKNANIKLKLHFLNQYSKAYFKRYMGIRSVRFGSILLFINGFRIASYGDYGNDWLNIEVRKGQGRARFLGTRDLVGWFEINDTESIFKIISNREGLVKNKAYQQLVGDTSKNFTESYFYSIFRKLELFVVEGLDWDRISKTKTEDNIEEDEKYEIKSFMNDFEAKIYSNNWKYNPSKERYAESGHEKNMRILKQIFKIITIGTKKKDIISLYINEEVLSELADENLDFVKSIIQKMDEFDKMSLATKTSKGISQIKKVFAKMEAKQKQTEDEKKKAEAKAQEAEQKTKNAEEKAAKAEARADKEEEKRKYAETKHKESEKRNLFLQGLLGKDTKEIIGLQHQIKISTSSIREYITHLKLTPQEEMNLVEYNNILDSVMIENEKISSIVEFITQANYDLKASEIEEDIIQFIKQYLENIHPVIAKKYNKKIMNVIFKGEIPSFVMEFKPLEITIILDNLISNSQKAASENIEISFIKKDKNTINISFKDDGTGIHGINLNELFDFGVTHTDGSGIGLYHVKEILKGMNGRITINNKCSRGVEFIMEIKK